MDSANFESKRLELFERHGFVGTTRWVEGAHGRRTFALVRPGNSRPTILIHGGLSQAGSWCLTAGLLPGHVIILDRPGWGLSYAHDYRSTDMRQDSVVWLEEVLDALGADEVNLVGASIGGLISAWFALANPSRVRRIVFVGALPGLQRKFPLPLRLVGNPLVGRLIARLKITDPEVNRKRVFPNIVAHPENVPVDVLQDDIDAMALPGAGRTGYTMMRSMSTIRGFRPSVLIADDLERLECPVLFLWGDVDRFVPIEVGRRVAGRMHDARFHVVPDAGHSIEIDQPDVVAEQVRAFFRD